MEGDTFLLMFLMLFLGVVGLSSLSVPKGTGIVARSGGMFGLPSAPFMFLLAVAIVIVLILIIALSSFDASSMKMEGGTIIALSLLVVFGLIFVFPFMLSRPKYTPPPPPRSSGLVAGIFRMIGFSGFFLSPFFWIAAMIIFLVVSHGGL